MTKKQFEQFLSDTGLASEDVETMGSIGAPGFGLGASPAISFNGEAQRAIQNAYVTVIPLAKKVKELETLDRTFTDRDWERVRRAVINRYKYGV